MQNIQDLEKILNSELNTKIKNSLIKHDQIYLKVDEYFPGGKGKDKPGWEIFQCLGH